MCDRVTRRIGSDTCKHSQPALPKYHITLYSDGFRVILVIADNTWQFPQYLPLRVKTVLTETTTSDEFRGGNKYIKNTNSKNVANRLTSFPPSQLPKYFVGLTSYTGGGLLRSLLQPRLKFVTHFLVFDIGVGCHESTGNFENKSQIQIYEYSLQIAVVIKNKSIFLQNVSFI